MSTSSAVPTTLSVNALFGNAAQDSRDMTLESFVACLTVSAFVFVVEILAFVLLRSRFTEIYQPYNELGPETPSASGFLGWIRPTLSMPDTLVLQRSGLDAFFFLRFLRALLKIFVPLAFVVVPMLLPLNVAYGRSESRGLNKLHWADLSQPYHDYYWAYLVLALGVTVHFCYTIYQEFSEYVRIRQEYLVSPFHCHKASATTVLFTRIPNQLLFPETLINLFEGHSGGVRNVWINQDLSPLRAKIRQQEKTVALLEAEETRLIAIIVKTYNKKGYNKTSSPASLGLERGHSAQESTPLWKLYLRDEDRASMRLPILTWVPALPFFGRKVDVIEHCRQELTRLNTEIENDQLDSYKYPLLNSAFIQFHSQKAAHLACQTAAYHSPHEFVSQGVDLDPEDVVWENLSIGWWSKHVRNCLTTVSLVTIAVGWSVPIAFTGMLSQITNLVALLPWLHILEQLPKWLLGLVQGVLPQAILIILTILPPVLVRLLANHQGFSTGVSIEIAVQKYYFSFLFIHVFLTVSFSSSATTIITSILNGLGSVPSILAMNIPKTSNYFFSYLLLQALTISGGGLVQTTRLMEWFLLSPIVDRTPRQKWKRQKDPPELQWGTIYPVYTNLACIGIIFSVIAPLINVFSVITFTLFWIVFRYNLLYVAASHHDTHGRLYPNALNQLFAGIYIMEICLIGLFLLVRDDQQKFRCIGQVIIMALTTGLTVTFQVLLNRAFAPLLQFLSVVSVDQGQPSAGDSRIHHTSKRSAHVNVFQNEALRFRRPVVWIPKDNLGISDDEIYHTKGSYVELSISNDLASIENSGRLVIQGNAPRN